jgi:lysophospholipase L1-like esterase
VGASNLPVRSTTLAWWFLARVEVMAPVNVGAVAAIGDSITDGAQSTDNTNNRWTDHLAKRLNSPSGTFKMGVLNLGIGGNRLLGDGAGQSALARFDRDVLVQPGVTHVIVAEGINDIGRAAGPPVSLDDLIGAHKQLIERAHARGLKVIGATLTPLEGVTGNFASYFLPENEAKRNALNAWIRTSKAYDAVIDLDMALRDPKRPTQLRPEWASTDKLHPNDAGSEARATALDINHLKSLGLAGRPATR